MVERYSLRLDHRNQDLPRSSLYTYLLLREYTVNFYSRTLSRTNVKYLSFRSQLFKGWITLFSG